MGGIREPRLKAGLRPPPQLALRSPASRVGEGLRPRKQEREAAERLSKESFLLRAGGYSGPVPCREGLRWVSGDAALRDRAGLRGGRSRMLSRDR